MIKSPAEYLCFPHANGSRKKNPKVLNQTLEIGSVQIDFQGSVSSSEPQKKKKKSGNWQKGWGKDSRPSQITSLNNKYYLVNKKESSSCIGTQSNTGEDLRGGRLT